MPALIFAPFVVQGLAMFVDEGVHHRRRGLPRWERIGHPLDTLTVVACYAWLAAMRPTPSHGTAYVALAALSCLFVTKDERVHARRCSASEHWTHALLFVLHPIVLAIAGWLWWTSQPSAPLLARAQLVLTASFAAYQAIYWNWNGPWRHARSIS